jgi:uncharacterized membrane protein YfcA
MTIFDVVVVFLGIVAGAVASISGFGIGSILTPLLASQAGTKAAVAAVSIPHLLGTAVRFWTLRRHINRRVLLSFGLMSAAGGLTGALLNARANNPVLNAVFGALLMFAGITGLTGLSEKMRFGGKVAWVAGALSGFFGGLVGNQGGIRSASLLGFEISPQEFVGTATAIGLIVDAARIPVYLTNDYDEVRALELWVLLAAIGVLAGTWIGLTALRRVPPAKFRPVVSSLILALGIYMLFQV